jgi:hypothetical protein
MVKGLDLFKEHFASFSENYVLIGGVACTLALEDRGFDFRVTKDVDIVLCIEALNKRFVEAFWEFVRQGKYECRQQSTGKRLFYRFHSPSNPMYPEMIELFSRKPDALFLKDGGHLTPIPVDEEVSSLSAILLHEDYYRFIHEGKQDMGGLPIVTATHLIPLKARAWIDLSAQSAAGVSVDEKNIRKHRNDIIRLYRMLPENIRVPLPRSIQEDMQTFLGQMQNGASLDLKAFGLKNVDFSKILGFLKQVYGLSSMVS